MKNTHRYSKITIKIISLGIAAFMLTGCGSLSLTQGEKGGTSFAETDDAEPIPDIDEQLESLQEQLDALAKENAELKETLGKYTAEAQIEEVQEEINDDTIISIGDEKLIKYLREITGNNTGDITYGDIKDIRSIEMNEWVSGIECLKYFTSLTSLKISTEYDTDLDMLTNLTNLQSVDIRGASLADIDALYGLENLTDISLGIGASVPVVDLSNFKAAHSINLYGNALDEITATQDQDKLTSLSLGGKTIRSISGLEHLMNIKVLSIDGSYSYSLSGGAATEAAAPAADGPVIAVKNVGDSLGSISGLSGLKNADRIVITSDVPLNLSELTGCQALRELNLKGNGFTGFEAIGSLPYLDRIIIYSSMLTDCSFADNWLCNDGLFVSDNLDPASQVIHFQNMGKKVGIDEHKIVVETPGGITMADINWVFGAE